MWADFSVDRMAGPARLCQFGSCGGASHRSPRVGRNSGLDRVFHYITGEVVRYGDRVRAAGHRGHVAEVFQPASHTTVSCRCPEGGVLILSARLWNSTGTPSASPTNEPPRPPRMRSLCKVKGAGFMFLR